MINTVNTNNIRGASTCGFRKKV